MSIVFIAFNFYVITLFCRESRRQIIIFLFKIFEESEDIIESNSFFFKRNEND